MTRSFSPIALIVVALNAFIAACSGDDEEPGVCDHPCDHIAHGHAGADSGPASDSGSGGSAGVSTGGSGGADAGGSGGVSAGGGSGGVDAAASADSGIGAAPSVSCSDSCDFAADEQCDDGGPGSIFSLCELGTDCTDCGPR